MKSATDLFWDSRPSTTKAEKTNFNDNLQRQIECNFIQKFLNKNLEMLEVGCGNGYLSKWLSDRVKTIDAFDYSTNMIKQAKEIHQQPNVNYYEDSLVNPTSAISEKKYDLILCVRVLINLQSLEEQKTAIENMSKLLNKGGSLILIEGYSDGFTKLGELREKLGLSNFSPAPINFYSEIDSILPTVDNFFTVDDSFHSGCFDFLTRVVNPLLNGTENTLGVSDFHEKILPLCLAYNPDEFKTLARLHGFCLKLKS
jgi:ubiquinone/menaquinone biosynthesis C-methylase UbiE